MPRKRFETEQGIQKLREVEVLLSQSPNVSKACRQIGVTDNTYYRRRKEYGGHPERSGNASERAGECPFEEARGRSGTGQGHPERGSLKKLLSPAKRRHVVEHVRETVGFDRISERRTCRVLGQPRSRQRSTRHVPEDEPRLVRRIIDLAPRYGRYEHRRITMMLREEGWKVNHKRIER